MPMSLTVWYDHVKSLAKAQKPACPAAKAEISRLIRERTQRQAKKKAQKALEKSRVDADASILFKNCQPFRPKAEAGRT